MTYGNAVKPVELRSVGSEELLVLWNDSHRSLYQGRILRLNCPCANCVDEWTGKRTIRSEDVSQSVTLQNWQAVGHYGVRFSWSDGHSTGIFSFALLRELCACSFCLSSISSKPSPIPK